MWKLLSYMVHDEIYMEIPEGIMSDSEIRRKNLWKLHKSLYGLKISPKKME